MEPKFPQTDGRRLCNGKRRLASQHHSEDCRAHNDVYMVWRFFKEKKSDDSDRVKLLHSAESRDAANASRFGVVPE
jgi:hypothetical protein